MSRPLILIMVTSKWQLHTVQDSGVARGGVWGVQTPPHCEKMCIFYCLVFEQKRWLSLHFFSSVRYSLSDDVNVHSGIKETLCATVSPTTATRRRLYLRTAVYCIHIVM